MLLARITSLNDSHHGTQGVAKIAAGRHRLRDLLTAGTALLSAVTAAALAGNPTASGVSAARTDQELQINGTAADDHILLYWQVIEEGEVCPAGDEDEEPIPADRTRIFQVYDVVADEIVFDVAQLPGDCAAGRQTRQEAFEAWAEDPPTPIRVFGRAGNDIIDAVFATALRSDGVPLTGDGAPELVIRAGEGDDWVFSGDANDVIFGDGGNDVLDGGDGDDELTGGPGNDILRGGRGNDKMGGGGGWDVVDYYPDPGPAGVTVNLDANTATDGWGGTDALADNSFSAIRGKNTPDTLIGDPARTTTILGMGGDDNITGGTQADILFGDGGNDTITAGGGADFIFGGIGNDTIDGGDGDDTICGDGEPNPNWPVSIDRDRVISAPDADRPVDEVGPVTMDRIDDPDNPSRNRAARIPPSVPVGDDDPRARYIGNDNIKGGAGADTIYGGLGNDRINGDDGSDIIYGDFDYNLYALNRISGQLEWCPSCDAENDQDTRRGGNDRIRGGNGDDIIFPGGGSDIVSGGDNNTCSGLATQLCGGDLIYGSVGNDFLYGGEVALDDDGFATNSPLSADFSAADWVSYALVPEGTQTYNFIHRGPDGLDYPASITLYGEGVKGRLGSDRSSAGSFSDGDLVQVGLLLRPSRDLLSGIENVAGSPNDDLIWGSDIVNGRGTDLFFAFSRSDNSGYDNILMGLGGNDTLLGGLGDDLLMGEGVDIGRAVTGIRPIAPGNDILWGDNGDQFGSGNDTLMGEGGDDELHGEGGDDVLVGGPGNDLISGGAGKDLLDYSGETSYLYSRSSLRSVDELITSADALTPSPEYVDPLDPLAMIGIRVDLSVYPGTAEDGLDPDGDGLPGIDTIINCEDGSTSPDLYLSIGFINCDDPRNKYATRVEVIFGSNLAFADPEDGVADNVTTGYDVYNDRIKGYDDPAYPQVSTTIYGRAGNDYLVGGIGDDRLFGETETDYLEGLGGNDFLDGGPHTLQGYRDTVGYASADSPVEVSLGLTAPQNTRGAGWDTIVNCENILGGSGDDILTGNSQRNRLMGGPGNDLLHGRGDIDPVVRGFVRPERDILDGGGGTNIADYRLGNPELIRIRPDYSEAVNDGENGSDLLINIQQFLPELELDTLANLLRPVRIGPLVVDAGPDRVIRPGGSTILLGSARGAVAGNNPSAYRFIWDTEPPTPRAPSQALDDCSLIIPGLDNRCVARPTASPTRDTVYRLKVIVDNPAFGPAPVESSDFVRVTIASPLVVSAGPDKTINPGESTVLNGSASGGVTPYIFSWSPAAGLSRTDIPLPVAAPSAPTVYTLTVTDQTGQQVSDEVRVFVRGILTVSAGEDVTITAGDRVQLNATVFYGTPPYTYLWSPAAGLSSTTIPNPVASPSVTTTYTVTVTDGAGRTASDSIKVTVVPAVSGAAPPPPEPRRSPDEDNPPAPGTTGALIPPLCGGGLSLSLLGTTALLLMLMPRRRGRP